MARGSKRQLTVGRRCSSSGKRDNTVESKSLCWKYSAQCRDSYGRPAPSRFLWLLMGRSRADGIVLSAGRCRATCRHLWIGSPRGFQRAGGDSWPLPLLSAALSDSSEAPGPPLLPHPGQHGALADLFWEPLSQVASLGSSWVVGWPGQAGVGQGHSCCLL